MSRVLEPGEAKVRLPAQRRESVVESRCRHNVLGGIGESIQDAVSNWGTGTGMGRRVCVDSRRCSFAKLGVGCGSAAVGSMPRYEDALDARLDVQARRSTSSRSYADAVSRVNARLCRPGMTLQGWAVESMWPSAGGLSGRVRCS